MNAEDGRKRLLLVTGSPRKLDKPGELTNWQKFKCVFMPWLRAKYIQGEQALSTEVAIREEQLAQLKAQTAKIYSEARDIDAAANAKNAEALNTTMEAALKAQELEERKTAALKAIHPENEDRAAIEALKAQIEAKLIDYNKRYGLRVEALPFGEDSDADEQAANSEEGRH